MAARAASGEGCVARLTTSTSSCICKYFHAHLILPIRHTMLQALPRAALGHLGTGKRGATLAAGGHTLCALRRRRHGVGGSSRGDAGDAQPCRVRIIATYTLRTSAAAPLRAHTCPAPPLDLTGPRPGRRAASRRRCWNGGSCQMVPARPHGTAALAGGGDGAAASGGAAACRRPDDFAAGWPEFAGPQHNRGLHERVPGPPAGRWVVVGRG